MSTPTKPKGFFDLIAERVVAHSLDAAHALVDEGLGAVQKEVQRHVSGVATIRGALRKKAEEQMQAVGETRRDSAAEPVVLDAEVVEDPQRKTSKKGKR